MTIPKNLAQIRLLPARFVIEGPLALVTLTQRIAATPVGDPEDIKYLLMDAWSDWYVQCSISGEYFSLSDLKYWNVDKNEMYAQPGIYH